MHPTASGGVIFGIAALAVAVAAGFVIAVHRVRPAWTARAGSATALWLAVTFLLATSGVLGRFDVRPPPMGVMFLVVLGGGAALGLSPLGRALAELPLWVLVLAQAFRLPLELVMHAAATEGTMPRVMSYSGWNFDVATGAGALVVGLALRAGAPKALAAAWLAVAFATLGAIVTIAFLASPMIRFFGPDQINTWVTAAPFVWLPTVLVVAALVGQIALLRAIAANQKERTA